MPIRSRNVAKVEVIEWPWRYVHLRSTLFVKVLTFCVSSICSYMTLLWYVNLIFLKCACNSLLVIIVWTSFFSTNLFEMALKCEVYVIFEAWVRLVRNTKVSVL